MTKECNHLMDDFVLMADGQHVCGKCEPEEEALGCETCGGTGELEEQETQCDDSTGYNTIYMGTGRIIPCHDCCG